MDKIDDPTKFAPLLKMLPLSRYEFVDVTFAAADTDTVIPYSAFTPEDANMVRWLNVTQGAGTVYRAADPDRLNWAQGYVILRSTIAESTRLLLFLERE